MVGQASPIIRNIMKQKTYMDKPSRQKKNAKVNMKSKLDKSKIVY